jgi:hypothetical protein
MPNVLSRLFGAFSKSATKEIVNAEGEDVRWESEALPVHKERVPRRISSKKKTNSQSTRKKTKVLGETDGNPGTYPPTD